MTDKNGVIRKTDRLSIVNAKLVVGIGLVDTKSGEVLREFGDAYSYMKYSSQRDIEKLGNFTADAIIAQLENPNSELSKLFKVARDRKEIIVRIEPGSRNVEKAWTFVMDHAMGEVNAYLALNNLPTVIKIRPPRPTLVSGTYASMTQSEREAVLNSADHIIPGYELFKLGVHVIFSDDTCITGTTSDRVKKQVLERGALSYSEIFLVEIDQAQAQADPKIEAKLNHLRLTGDLDQTLEYVLNQPGFRPVQRLLKIILEQEDDKRLTEYMQHKIIPESIRKLYLAALSNDYLFDNKMGKNVRALASALRNLGVIDETGKIINRNYQY